MSGLDCWLRTRIKKERGGEKKKKKEKRYAQMISQYSRTENACGEEVTTQTRVATEKPGDCLVVEFFNVVSQSEAGPGERNCERLDGSCLPFLATMFHAVGLNVIDPKERKSDVLDTSRKALSDMIAEVVVEERPTKGGQNTCR